MYIFTEVWSPNSAWRALTVDERAAFVQSVAAGMSEHAAAGIEPLGWGFTDETSKGIDHVAFAVWRCPGRKEADDLRAAITAAGWYEYFDQVDFGGEVGPPDAVLSRHIESP